MAISGSASVEGVLGSLGVGGTLYRLMVFPFPPSHFQVHSFRGKEELSGLYSFDVVVTAAEVAEGVIERLSLGQRGLLVMRAGKAARAFHGVIASVRHEGARSSHGVSQYRMRLVPRVWLLRHRRRTRIFQHQRADEIIATVLKGVGIESEFKLQREYPAREYCTQYEETDYRFVRRLAAESGMFFRYAQPGTLAEEVVAAASEAIGGAVGAVAGAAASGALAKIFAGETMVFSDEAGGYAPIDDGSVLGAAAEALGVPTSASVEVGGVSASVGLSSPTLYYLSVVGTSTAAFDKVTRFEPTRRIRTNAATYREYDPERPLALITRHGSDGQGAASASASVSVGAGGLRASASVDVGGAVAEALGGVLETAELEYYEHHTHFLFPKWRYADDEPALILRQKRRKARAAAGESTCPALAVGHRFRLEEHPVGELNVEYAVTAVEHEGWATPAEAHREVYRNRFWCVPAEVVFCPPRPKRKSVMVALTATVVGPPGAEIHTDPVGQIKVQFHWDRQGPFDDRSSCWIRTMHAWGGPGWGTQFIPRIGMEVVVTFEGGDPDKPMVLGCLYNGTHPPSFSLPADKTRSGIRTQSSPGGGGFNELSFEDAAGKEQIYLHAQRNLDEKVGRNHTLLVQHEEFIRILGSRMDTIERNLETLVKGDSRSQVDGNRIDVVKGSSDHRVSGTLSTRVDGRERRRVGGNADLEYGEDLTTRVVGSMTTVVGKQDKKRSWATHAEATASLSGTDLLELRSEKELVLRVGKSSIRISVDAIELTSAEVRVKGGDAGLSASDAGLALSSKGDAQVVVGKKLVLKTDGASLAMEKEVKVDGSKILLNSPEQAKDPSPKDPEPPTTIELSDDGGAPLPQQRYLIVLDDGAELSGMTDSDGKAELELKSDGKVIFPDLTTPDDVSKGPPLPYVIRQGDYLQKLAFAHGFTEDEVWNDAKNAELKEKRKSPNLLHPGDIVHFPRSRREGQSLSKGTTNKYKVTVPKTIVRFSFKDDSGPFAGEAYVVEGLGAPSEGTTDESGMLTIEAPVYVREVQITFPARRLAFPMRIGDMDPVDETAGVRKRLEHLGYLLPGWEMVSEDEAAARDRQALAAFQRAEGLSDSGELDDATKSALEKAHGS